MRAMSDGLSGVVDPEIQRLVRRELELLVELREALERDQSEEHRRVADLIRGLDELFTIVIVGEFNAGKSSLINALFGQKLRVEGPVPVDDQITVLRHGSSEDDRTISDYLVERHYPIEFLTNITLVDTPGTNSIVQRHQEITEDFVPRADLILFVTSIDRPLSESERQFLDYIRDWGKKVVLILNKIDTKTPEEIDEVITWLGTNLRAIFSERNMPVIFPVAAKLALDAKLAAATPRDWTRSRFEQLEDYIFNVLSARDRLILKLEAPLETIRSLGARQQERIEAQRSLLRTDLQRIESTEEQLELAKDDMLANFDRFTTRVDNLMLELQDRGTDFLERYIRVTHIMLLRDTLRFKEEFQRQVFHDWEGSVDRTIQEGVDWLVKQNMRLWNDTVGRVLAAEDKPLSRSEGVVGRVGSEFAYNRDEIYGRMHSEAERRMRSYDVGVESRKTIDGAMSGVIQSLGLGVGAFGLGYLVTTAVTSAAIDVTGLTAATILFVTSFLVLPYKRNKAKNEFRERIDELRKQLGDSLRRESQEEIGRILGNIRQAFEPYERFYRSESQKIETFSVRLASIEERAQEILAELDALRR
jgi:small GTP-binding protein